MRFRIANGFATFSTWSGKRQFYFLIMELPNERLHDALSKLYQRKSILLTQNDLYVFLLSFKIEKEFKS